MRWEEGRLAALWLTGRGHRSAGRAVESWKRRGPARSLSSWASVSVEGSRGLAGPQFEGAVGDGRGLALCIPVPAALPVWDWR